MILVSKWGVDTHTFDSHSYEDRFSKDPNRGLLRENNTDFWFPLNLSQPKSIKELKTWFKFRGLEYFGKENEVGDQEEDEEAADPPHYCCSSSATEVQLWWDQLNATIYKTWNH